MDKRQMGTRKKKGYLKIHIAVAVEDIKSRKILPIMKVIDDEHIHDSKMLPELVQRIIKSNSSTATGKLFADGVCAYDSNEILEI
jgi:hypothetical protein